MSKNLFNIADEYLQIVQELEENGGEVNEEILDRLNINRNELHEKLNAYKFVITQIEGDIKTIKELIETLNSKIKTKENVISSLKERILFAVDLYGETDKKNPEKKNKKVKTDLFSFYTVYHQPVQILVNNPKDFKDERFKQYVLNYKFTKEEINKIKEMLALEENSIVVNIDKVALKKALSNGEHISDAIIDEEGHYVGIR